MSDTFIELRQISAKKRIRANFIVNFLSIVFAIIGLLFLFWIIVTLFVKGLAGFSFDMFLKDSIDSGIRNAIVGHIIIIFIASVIGIPIGLAAGT